MPPRPPRGWEVHVDETSAGVYRATARGPGGETVERTGTDLAALLSQVARDATEVAQATVRSSERAMSSPERRFTLPDGRELRATHEGEPVGWVVCLVGREDRFVAARDIHDALVDLLDLAEGDRPTWLREAAEHLAARDTQLGRRYPCPCCGYLTLEDVPTGSYELCDVCFWEDDGIQFHNLDYEGGANEVSLDQARRNFREHGVSDIAFEAAVRPPLAEEQP